MSKGIRRRNSNGGGNRARERERERESERERDRERERQTDRPFMIFKPSYGSPINAIVCTLKTGAERGESLAQEQ